MSSATDCDKQQLEWRFATTASGGGECIGAVFPVEEICDDGIDNNCDGLIDENCQIIESSTTTDSTATTTD